MQCTARWIPNCHWNIEHNSALSSNKVPGSDIIPTEIYKVGGQPMTENPSELFYCMWRKEAIAQELKDVAIIHPYIRKGNARVCDSHRGISSLYCLLPGRYWPNPTDSPACISWSDWNSTSKSVLIQESQKTNWYDPFSQEFLTEISKTKYGPQRDLCRQCQSFWHSQPWLALENYNNVWLSSQVYSNGSVVHRGMLARLQNDREYSTVSCY